MNDIFHYSLESLEKRFIAKGFKKYNAKQIFDWVQELNQEEDRNVAVLGDFQGPKLRLGNVEENQKIKKGQEITITTDECIGNSSRVYITYPDFPKDVKVGDRIMLDDGKLILRAESTNERNEVKAMVVQGGELKSKKGVNLPNTKVSLPALTVKDIKDAIFACENNLFSEFSHTSTVLHGELIARAQALEMPAIKVDGNDVVEVWRAAQIAVDRARNGGGPTFIEAMTYRMAGHVEAETGFLQGAQYRESSEVEAWKAKDPIDRFLKWNLETGKVPQATLQELDAELIKELEEAMAFALSSPEPPPEQAFQFMFADHEA